MAGKTNKNAAGKQKKSDTKQSRAVTKKQKESEDKNQNETMADKPDDTAEAADVPEVNEPKPETAEPEQEVKEDETAEPDSAEKSTEKAKPSSANGKPKPAKVPSSNQHLLLSKCVTEMFRRMTLDDLKAVLPDNQSGYRDGNLDSYERMYLATLLCGIAGHLEANLRKPDMVSSMTCAEFYAEFFPAKLHTKFTEKVLCDRLTLALRRDKWACKVKEDPRVQKFVDKIPDEPQEKPIGAEPLSPAEIYTVINAVCDLKVAKAEMGIMQKQNLALFAVTISKQGNVNRNFITPRIDNIKTELKINTPGLNLTPESVMQLFDLYAKFVTEPPKQIPMLTPKSQEPEAAKKPDDDVDLSEWMKEMDVSKPSAWGLFFKNLTLACKDSSTLRYIIKQSEGGNMTAAIQFREAYQNFPDFDWVLAFGEFPGEQTKLWQALEDLAVDPYCGFGTNNPHPTSQYIHLAYLGLSLQERVGRQTSLAGYKGLDKMKHLLTKKYMIDRWVSVYAQNCYYGQSQQIPYEDPTLKYANFKIPNKSQSKPSYDFSGDSGYYMQDYKHHMASKSQKPGKGRGQKAERGWGGNPGPSGFHRYEGGYGDGPYSDQMFEGYGYEDYYGGGASYQEGYGYGAGGASGYSEEYKMGLRHGMAMALRELGANGAGRGGWGRGRKITGAGWGH